MGTIPSVMSEVQAIVDTNAERELWVVGREFERPPYFHTNEGINNRLAKALRVVVEGRIHPHCDGSFTIEGSEGRQYRCAESCSCPYSQKSRTKWCYHMVATALYKEWCTRLGYAAQQPALALPPVSVDERLAQTPATTAQEPLGEEIASMADDPYIPEPDAPGAVPEAQPLSMRLTLQTPATSSLDAPALRHAMQAWSAQRQVVTEFLRTHLREGVDFYSLRIKGRETKPTLSKAGAEKFLGLLQLAASFTPDLGTWEMLGKPTDQVLYVCTLQTRSGEVVGEGRGSRCLKQDGGDTNKSIKMASKSSLIDAVLRTGALSEVFTQDREPDEEEPPAPPARPSSGAMRQRIWALVKAADATITTREACEAYVQRVTGYALVPDHYGAIVTQLEGR